MDYRQPRPRKSQHALIVHELGKRIVSGYFQPEERLPAETQLCHDYEVSRTVLRESMRVLIAKGLVWSKPRVGSVVRPRHDWHTLDPDVLHWIMQTSPPEAFHDMLAEVRHIVEPATAALAARHATHQEADHIGDAFSRMEAASDGPHDQSLPPDFEFHCRIAEASHNPLLAHLCTVILQTLHESIKQATQPAERHKLSLPRHRAILTAIQNHDALGARQASLVQLESTCKTRHIAPSLPGCG